MKSRPLPIRLVLYRHGPAGKPEDWAGGDDSLRPLTAEGRTRTLRSALGLLEIASPDLMISSDFVRAQETAAMVNSALAGLDRPEIRIHTTPALRPEAKPDDFKRFLKTFKPHAKTVDTILVVGHEPSLGTLAASVLGLRSSPGKVGKAGAVLIDTAGLDGGELVGWMPPKVLRKLGRAAAERR